MTNRRDDRQQGEPYGRYDNRQYEQFEQRGRHGRDRYAQMGEAYGRDDMTQMGSDYGEYEDYDDRRNERGYGSGAYRRSNFSEGGQQGRPSTFGSPYGGSYARSAYRDRGSPPYGDFTANDIGGRDFSGARQRFGHGGPGVAPDNVWGAGSYGVPAGAAPRSAYFDRDERGFLDRAGDEIASWFGDEDAARRREMDHTGYGPANYTRSDERILEDVCDRITRDWAVDGRAVQVTVQGGEVTLDGTVPSRQQKRRAEDCADDVSGVSHVQNNLRVQLRGAEEVG